MPLSGLLALLPDQGGRVIGWGCLVVFLVWLAFIVRAAYLRQPFDWSSERVPPEEERDNR